MPHTLSDQWGINKVNYINCYIVLLCFVFCSALFFYALFSALSKRESSSLCVPCCLDCVDETLTPSLIHLLLCIYYATFLNLVEDRCNYCDFRLIIINIIDTE